MDQALRAMAWPPALSRRGVSSWLLAGLAGHIALTLTIQGILPALFGSRSPSAALVRAVFCLETQEAAVALQLLLTILLLPVLFVFVVRPLARGIVSDMPWWLMGSGYGAVMCIGALARLAFGGPPVDAADGFTLAVWPGLTASIVYGLALSGVLHWRRV